MNIYYNGPYEYTSEYNSIPAVINFMENKVKERIDEARKLYLYPAMKNYGTNPGNGALGPLHNSPEVLNILYH